MSIDQFATSHTVTLRVHLRCVSVTVLPRLHEDDVKTIRACLHEDDAGTFKDALAFVWSDDEVELLLSRVNDYKTSSGVDWDTVCLKHFVFRGVFPNVSKNVHHPVIGITGLKPNFET